MAKRLFVNEIQGALTSNTPNKVFLETGFTLIVDKVKALNLETDIFKFKNGNSNIISFNNNTSKIILENDTKLKSNNSDGISSSATLIQRKLRMITSDFDYPTGGGYSQNFAHATCFRTKITTKKDNSVIIIKMGVNGEGNTTHNWVMYPVRSFIDTVTMNITNYDHNIARHQNDGENPNSTYEYYCFGYTNPGAYNDGDYDSTPIQTATMEFIDTPNVSAGTDIWYSLVLMCSASATFFINRSVNASVGGGYERGVSYVNIEEYNGANLNTSEVQIGITEYTF